MENTSLYSPALSLGIFNHPGVETAVQTSEAAAIDAFEYKYVCT